MKLLLILAVAAVSNAAKLDRTYLPPNAQTSGGSGTFLETPISGPSSGFNGPTTFSTGKIQSGPTYSNNYPQAGSYAQNDDFAGNTANYGRPERTQAALERNAAILRQYSQNDGDNFAYAFETENGIYAEENGVAANGVEAQGGYSYTGDDGQVYSIRYTAGQDGFVPQGDHLPTAPPVPEEILKALEQNARDEAAGIYDDGSYNEGKYNSQYDSNNGNRGNGNANNGKYNDNDDTVVTNSAFFPETGAVGLRNTESLKSYLPPVRGSNGNAFGRRQSFNSRDGYQY